MTAQKIQQTLRRFATKEKAAVLRRFFKTGPGQYGEGDRFLGVMVPNIRRVVQEFRDAPLSEVTKLMPWSWSANSSAAMMWSGKRSTGSI
jgi:hypothetical protein